MINARNENQDLLGDLVKQPLETQRGYDPGQWRDAARGGGNNRVLMHGSGNDAVELIEPQQPIPRMVALPDTDAEAIPVLDGFFADNADLKPHAPAIVAEVGNIRQNAPDFGRSETFNLAVARVCKANNLPLQREAPLPPPLKASTLTGEMQRLEAEAKKVRTEVGQDYASVRRAIIETSPRPAKRR